jgi:enoyl-CoA hydratase
MAVQIQVDQHIAKVTIDRPEALNALNGETLKQLREVIKQINERDDVRAVLFMGAGVKSFVAGADIAEMQPLNPIQGQCTAQLGQSVFDDIAHIKCPTIAMIQGYALGGGCELSLACDLRIASEKAKFGQPEVGLGIIPGFGGTQRLARLVGPGQAKHMIFTGEIISAAQAFKVGLVDQLVPPDQLIEQAEKLAQSICAKSPNAVRMAKEAIDQGLQGTLSEGLRLEAGLFGLCFASPEQKEGMSAFLEKRPASF